MKQPRHTLALFTFVLLSSASCGGSDDTAVKHADAATLSGGDAGSKLSCTQREQRSGQAISDARDAATLACTTNADCEQVPIDTDCHFACGALISKADETKLQAVIAEQNATTCKTYAADGCKRIEPPCIPPQAFACVSGRCASVPYGQDGGN